MRKVAVVFVAISALAFAACGGDDTTPTKIDKGKPKPDTGKTQQPEASVPLPPDKSTTPGKEMGITPPDASQTGCTTPFQAKANSGKSCTTDPASCSADEVCLGFKNAAGADVGMCVGKCCANEANQSDPVNLCPTPTPTTLKFFSPCGLVLQDKTTGKPSGMACAYICESGTTKFDCPNATDYDCIAPFPTQPTIKVCVPKT